MALLHLAACVHGQDKPPDTGDTPGETGDTAVGIWEDVQAGSNAACGRRAGAWECWGNPDLAAIPAEIAEYPQISLGVRAGCGRDDDGGLACWGRGPVVNVGPPEGTGYLDLDVGAEVACALTPEGAPACWGDDDVFEEGIVEPPEGLDLVTVEAGGILECGLDAAGTITCWGEPENAGVPLLEPPPGAGWVDLALDESAGCAVYAERIWCWGWSPIDILDPPRSLHALEVDANLVGGLCARTTAQRLECWGEFGSGESEEGQPPALPDADYAAMALGTSFVCGLTTTGLIHCAGDNSEGQLDVPP